MPFAQNGAAKIAWDERGQGTPILLVMGHRYSSAMWYPLIPALAERHRVIWFDNRGTGKSDTTKGPSIEEFAADGFAVLDAAGVDRAHIFGCSMGGVIVEAMALAKPERVISLIVGCSGMLTADKPRTPAFVRLLYRLPPWVMRLLLPRGRGHGYGSAAADADVATDQAVVAKDPYTVDGVIAQAAAIAAYSTTKEAIAGLTMPSLVIHGDEDATVPIAWGRELAETLPNGRFVEMTGAGHNFLVACPAKTRETVLGFLAEVDGAAAAAG
jgi:pimeloyl-ACP methyl ester carboxylesterase